MNALSLYHDLKARGVILEAQGEYLKVDAPVGVVTEEDKTALVEFKPTLLKFLTRPQRSAEGTSPRKQGPLVRTGAHTDTRSLHERVARVAGRGVPARGRCRSRQKKERRPMEVSIDAARDAQSDQSSDRRLWGGPNTQEGKEVVRWNATRHGISSPARGPRLGEDRKIGRSTGTASWRTSLRWDSWRSPSQSAWRSSPGGSTA